MPVIVEITEYSLSTPDFYVKFLSVKMKSEGMHCVGIFPVDKTAYFTSVKLLCLLT